MATHTEYPEIKRWAERTGRRSVQMWLREETLRALDDLCRERALGRAAMLDAMIGDIAPQGARTASPRSEQRGAA
jgi:hypothetical protein